jgi:hypothetical protein
MEENKDLFTTYSLNLAAVLVAYGCKLEKVTSGVGFKSLFCFVNSKKLRDINDKYWRKELATEPQLLFDSLKFLKNRLYSDLENSNGH